MAACIVIPVDSLPDPCPAFLVVVTYIRSVQWVHRAELDFPRVNLTTYRPTGGRRLPTPVPHLRTFYLTVSLLLCKVAKPSNAILSASYVPHDIIQRVLGFLKNSYKAR